ncbi:decaprenyl-phosphate phosphoribosyltransferase [Nocardioides nitrophenolicus]|uniref:decaprenyl-phosphate phosphoribosyltransferase n=1 Tax=Nocardioides nitrophenolicus TaxID=60489 RepID=UPI00195D5735|nr:decaprenyl-phosphate phosphoribosyltransferase [Nocardioides nitrophenolicus]MBM7519385.1 decaprenyl-phosphate phosphoribosyltransferase [Nocardioides nitrophenolicus]
MSASSAARGLVRTARPRQWVKNVLVVAGPLAAGNLFSPDPARAVLVAFVSFCIAASSVYLINDALDVEADRAHPTKRNRPIAAGLVSVRSAYVTAAALIVVVLAATFALGYAELTLLLAVYIALQLAYCIFLKHQPVLDLAVVSSGFLLRAVAGGVAADVELSPWFLLVAAFGSLFMVAGKRYSEVHVVGEGNATTRPSLELYSQSYLRFVWSIAAAATVVFYSLWAVGGETVPTTLAELSIVPFVLAMLRYAVDIDRGAAGEPEAIVLGDRVLQFLGVLWLVVFAAGVLTR